MAEPRRSSRLLDQRETSKDPPIWTHLDTVERVRARRAPEDSAEFPWLHLTEPRKAQIDKGRKTGKYYYRAISPPCFLGGKQPPYPTLPYPLCCACVPADNAVRCEVKWWGYSDDEFTLEPFHAVFQQWKDKVGFFEYLSYWFDQLCDEKVCAHVERFVRHLPVRQKGRGVHNGKSLSVLLLFTTRLLARLAVARYLSQQ